MLTYADISRPSALHTLPTSSSHMPDTPLHIAAASSLSLKGAFLTMFFFFPFFPQKHQLPGYSGHIPLHRQHVIGGTYSMGTLTAYEREACERAAVSSARDSAAPAAGSGRT